MREIHVVGSCNMDLVMQVATLPAPGHTVLGGSFLQVSGGKGANQAVAAKRAGGTVVLHAALGDDAYGDELLSQYVGSGIDCSNVIRVPNCPTGTAVIDGERIPGLAQLYSSPIYAGGRVYFTDRNGVTVVLKPGPTVDVVATNALKEGVDASLVAVGKQLFVRGQKSLFCIETKE